MMKFSLGALVAAGVLAGGFATSASAADLGGNCCADLEERIAELEATTARKGNRKVSLTISGWVGQQVTWWDDGEESNVYVHDLGTTLASHVKFTGQATISPGWSAGYVLHLETVSSDSLTTSADRDNGPAVYTGTPNGVQTLQSFWFVKSDTLGKLSVGRQSQASDNAAILVDGSGSLVPANWVAFDVNSFAVRSAAVAPVNQISWGNAGSCRGMGGAWGDCNGLTQNVVRYDSPTYAGFSVSASWGEDDMWDIAGRFSGEFNGVKVAAAVAYNEVSDESYPVGGLNPPGTPAYDGKYFQAGLYLEHVPTGVFGLFNYGHLDTSDSDIASPAFSEVDSDTYYFKAGLRRRWSPLGHTVLYGEYLRNNDGMAQFSGDSSKLDVWGLGVVQEIDAAAMSVWLKYRHLSYEDNFLYDDTAEDFQYVGFGALINF
jgi:predicted porin